MTIMLAILMAAQPSPEFIEQADQASVAYIDCLFAQSREAHAAKLSVDDFKRKLSGACTAEQSRAQGLMADVLAQRGESDPSATAERLMGEIRRSVVTTYESLPKLEKIAEICRQQPEACD